MDPYATRFDKYRGMGHVAGPSAAEQRGREQASGTADIMRLLSGIAPAAGTALGAGIGTLAGGPVGTAAGGAIGGALGQVGGGLLSGGADLQTKKYEDRDMARQEKLNALLAAFGRGAR